MQTLKNGGNFAVQLREQTVAVNAHLAEQGGDEPAVLIDESIKQMLRGYIAVIVFLSHGLCGLDGFNGFLSVVLSVHK